MIENIFGKCSHCADRKGKHREEKIFTFDQSAVRLRVRLQVVYGSQCEKGHLEQLEQQHQHGLYAQPSVMYHFAFTV